ncbi:hypothetical protein [Pistricoccus aurantiacus]|uniref:hypothetical protein n=1 Tax=Pistricoccus aurantiacus TaxID=1883414 RepID=UPI00363C86A6
MQMKYPRWILTVLFIIAMPALAIDLADLEAAKERASIIDRVRELLADDSPSVRLAVFEEVMKGDDPVLRSMALETALNADDERLKTAALRQLIRDRDNILIEIVQPVDPSQAQAYLYAAWRELIISELKIDESTDEITGRFSTAQTASTKFTGQLIRGGWQLRLARPSFTCFLTMSEVSGVELSGALQCSISGRATTEDAANANSATLPARVKLS